MDGGFLQVSNNIMLIATTNRRHITQEFSSDNHNVTVKDSVLHYSDEKNDALALSDRFGLTISFYSLSKHDYLALIQKEIEKDSDLAHLTHELIMDLAHQFSMQKGGTNGRTAMQCIDYIRIMHSTT